MEAKLIYSRKLCDPFVSNIVANKLLILCHAAAQRWLKVPIDVLASMGANHLTVEQNESHFFKERTIVSQKNDISFVDVKMRSVLILDDLWSESRREPSLKSSAWYFEPSQFLTSKTVLSLSVAEPN